MAETQQPQPPRPVAMDPPHITEFASDRYFEKLNQLNQQQQQQQQPSQPETAESSTANVESTFILPLRETKTVEPEPVKQPDLKKQRSRFFGLRHKVSLLHGKPHTDEVEPPLPALPTLPIARPSTDSAKKVAPFDQLFLALPNELQVQILSSLPLTDILSLRLANKTWHTLITLNEAPIVRFHLDTHIPAYALRLYPVADQSEMNFHYICSLWHRLHVAAKVAFLMCEWITKDIFLRQTDAEQLAFAPQRERMRRRLIPLLFTIFHFFETYRKLHLKYMSEHEGRGLQKEPYTLNPIEAEIMAMYDDQTLLRVHEIFPVVISSFCRRLRPPTYVGRVERSLRGYLRERPSDETHSAILCIGGLRQVERLWEIKGYNNRRNAVDHWYNGLTKDNFEPTPAVVPTKSRLGLKAFGRRKTNSDDRPAGRLSISGESIKTRSPSGSIDATNMDYLGFDPNWVFNTSLAADLPMAPLSHDNAQTVLSDLPVLQQIWLTTAEAIIFDRGIVSRPQDIKRNHHVLSHLIREDGMCEEDEWWYGRNNPDSVRPPANATAADDEAD